MPVTISFADQPPYATYSPIRSNMPVVSYLHWTIEAEATDAGVPRDVASLLSHTLVTMQSVLFLSSCDSKNKLNEWSETEPGTWLFCRTGLLKRSFAACLSSRPEKVVELFSDDYYAWDQRGQLALLFEKGIPATSVDGNRVLHAIEQNDLRSVDGLAGYLRSGDDGDFGELGMQSREQLREFQAMFTFKE